MTIEISNKEAEQIKRLDTALRSDVIMISEVKSFLSGLQMKLNSPDRKRNNLKEERKNKYKLKIVRS